MVKAKLLFQLTCHCDAGRACPHDDNRIVRIRIMLIAVDPSDSLAHRAGVCSGEITVTQELRKGRERMLAREGTDIQARALWGKGPVPGSRPPTGDYVEELRLDKR